MPSAKSQTEIKTNLTIYRSQILQLGAAINTTKLQGYNVSSAETSFNVLMVLLEQAETYANAGDYFNANQLLDDIKSQMATVNSNLESAKQVQPWPIDSLKLVLIIVVVAVAGFLVYLFWPSRSSYSPGRGYAYRTEEKKIHKEDFASAMRKVVGTTKEAASRMKKKVEKKKEYAEWGQES